MMMIKKETKGAKKFLLLLLFTAYSLQVVALNGCSKTEEESPAIAVGEKKGETTVSAEVTPPDMAESYKEVLVVSEIEGVDWQHGTITAIGKGLPPQHVTSPAQVRILTARAAKMEAYKSLLETIMKMKTPPDKGMQEYLAEKNIEMSRIEGFVKGARVVKEEYKDDGSVEITIEAPLAGVSGLISVLQ